MAKLGRVMVGLLAGAMPLTAYAQDQAPAPQTSAQDADMGEEDVEEVVVTGELRGAVPGDIKPEVSLDAGDIRAYGSSSINELLTDLAPLTGSARGREGGQPVVLLNGRRISGMREIRDIPTEAIERVDILPEEAALKFGYRADQRVVNFVLRRRFQAITAEVQGRVPTAGGNSTLKGDLDVLKIARDKRINFDVEYTRRSQLLESERGVVRETTSPYAAQGNIALSDGSEIDPALSALAGQSVTVIGLPAGLSGAPTLASLLPGANRANVTDVTPYRTLQSPQQTLEINGTYSRNLSNKVIASFNAGLEVDQGRSLLGLPTATLTIPAANAFSPFANDVRLYRYIGTDPLIRDRKSQTAHGGFSFNGDGLPWNREWRWSLTGNYDLSSSRTLTDRGYDVTALQGQIAANTPGVNPFAPPAAGALALRPVDRAESTSSVGSVDALVSGPLAKLPAGKINLSVRASGRTNDYDARSLRSGVLQRSDISRDSGNVQANLDLPIASRRSGVLSAIGDLTLNGNIEVEQLSDFGTLVTSGYGFHWSPIPQARLIFSVTDEEGAPSAQQLGDPVLVTPLVRVFDYVRGESVDVTTISGGNPFLRADNRHVMKLGLNLRPFSDKDFNLRADFVTTKTRGDISAFPAATAAVEAAFPGRFVRDPGGRLVSIDTRAVNFESHDQSQLRWGFNFSAPVASGLQKKIERMRGEYRAAVEKSRADGTPLPAEYQRMQQEFSRMRQRQGQGGVLGGGGQGQRQGAQGQRGPGAGPGGPDRGAGPGGGRSRGGFGSGSGGGRVGLSVFHTWRFKDEIRIGPGLPVLDLLDGSATGSRGGTREHQVEADAFFSRDGLVARVQGRWQSPSQVLGGTLGNARELNFDSLGTLNLRLEADLGRQFSLAIRHPFVRGLRVRLDVDNVFDAKQRVTDENGVVPITYRPELDTSGRVVRLTLRKLFF